MSGRNCSKTCDMPMLGYGTLRLPNEQITHLISKALEVGFKHFDCANIYDNEHIIGEVFKSLPDRKSNFITSKLWSSMHEPHSVKKGLNKSLSDLNLEYLDLYLIHLPVRIRNVSIVDNKVIIEGFEDYAKERILETWREMEKLVEAGLCKHIGVSNFTIKKLQNLLDDASIIPANNQIELQPYLPQEELVQFCWENGIIPSAYAPLGDASSINTPFENLSKPSLLRDPILAKISSESGYTPAQVLLAWSLNRKTPTLIKCSSESRMKENIASLQIKLSDEHIKAVDSMKRTPPVRFFDMPYLGYPGVPVDIFTDKE